MRGARWCEGGARLSRQKTMEVEVDIYNKKLSLIKKKSLTRNETKEFLLSHKLFIKQCAAQTLSLKYVLYKWKTRI